MFLSLLVFGILLTVGGSVLMGFGILLNALPTGMPLVLAGTLAAVGGLILIGLSAVVAQLAQISAALKAMQPAARPEQTPEISVPQPEPAVAREPAAVREPARESAAIIELPVVVAAAVPHAAPSPGPVSPAADVSASAIERLRSIVARPEKVAPEAAEVVPLSPNGQFAAHHVAPPRPAGGTVAEVEESRFDFLFRQRPARTTAHQQEAFETLWPGQPAHEGEDAGLPRVAPSAAAGRHPAPVAEDDAPEAAPVRAVTILKSGVVDGMAYTLYADGSIEAQLPQGTVRFGSIAELRAHIETGV